MKRQCIFTNITFDTLDTNDLVCPSVREAIVNVVMKDKSLQRRVSAEMLGDADTIKELAKTIMSTRATEVGLSYPGTISEFFLELRDQVGN